MLGEFSCTCTLELSERTFVGMYVSFKDKRKSGLCLGQMYVPELTDKFFKPLTTIHFGVLRMP